MNPTEFSEAIKQPGVFLLDVRPSEFYEKSHIPVASNLDVTAPNFAQEALEKLPKNETIAVYCNTGKHSAIAEQELEKLGFKIINLDNGINSWIAAKYPTT